MRRPYQWPGGALIIAVPSEPSKYGRRSFDEAAMMRYKQLIGRPLRARSLSAQKVEAAIGCKTS